MSWIQILFHSFWLWDMTTPPGFICQRGWFFLSVCRMKVPGG